MYRMRFMRIWGPLHLAWRESENKEGGPGRWYDRLCDPALLLWNVSTVKIVIDRFCSYNSSITRKHMKSALLTVAWNSDNWTFDALESHYQTLVRYLDFQDQGMVLGRGCGTPSMTRHSRYPEMAYKLGNRLWLLFIKDRLTIKNTVQPIFIVYLYF